MPQLFLDPEDANTLDEWHPSGPLPEKVWRFRRYPNLDDWRPGDLLLFHKPRQRNILSTAIIKAQRRGGFISQDALWHHAAVYIGHGELCEATVWSGVICSSIDKYFINHWVRVRRPDNLLADQHFHIAIRSLTQLKEKYSKFRALKVGWKSLSGYWRPIRLTDESNAMICSALYQIAYFSVTGTFAASAQGRPILPADLSQSGKFSDVAVHWRAIA